MYEVSWLIDFNDLPDHCSQITLTKYTVRTPIVDRSLLQDPPLKILTEDPSKSNHGKWKTFSNKRPIQELQDFKSQFQHRM